MDYNVKTRILLDTNFNAGEFNDLMYESTKPHIIEDIKSVQQMPEGTDRISECSCHAVCGSCSGIQLWPG